MSLHQIGPRLETAETDIATLETTLGVISGGQIPFPATQNPSSNANTLDDYEEGTWTPVLTAATPGDLSVVYSVQLGYYTKIGRMVFVNYDVTTSTWTHTTAAGNISITGLPFTSSAGITWRGLVRGGGWTKAGYTQLLSSILAGGTTVTIAATGSGAAPLNLAITDTPTGTQQTYNGCVAYPV